MVFFRKHQKTERDLSPGSFSRSSTRRSRSPFSLSKSLSRASISTPDGGPENPKGPLGLNLLSSPDDAKVDLIFVHGLGGGSRKTWSKTPVQSHYWPQEWLPEDPAFRNVRIHSYGYDSDYLTGREDCLNIHHIGKSLLGALSTSPCLTGSDTPIIAVGHSMGGLVIKKAYILARQDAAQRRIADRLAVIYFLATPHRGSDSARLLKNILRVASERAYVGDLERNSGAIQVINDEFRHLSASLELWSFYETQVMKPFTSPIVDPESAVLGYREEKQIPMNADHRSICKFDSPEDPNYVSIRNALASTVAMLSTVVSNEDPAEEREQIRELKKYLGVSTELYEDDLLAVSEARDADSCHWLSAKDCFIRWRESQSQEKRVLWINGKPATGKSVLAGYAVEELRRSNESVSFFFFKHGDKSKSRLRSCLQSLAFQMTVANLEARRVILQMRDDGIRLDQLDERTMWRVLFTAGIFTVLSTDRQFWVIDGLDECSNPSAFLDFAISRKDRSLPPRILLTSRDTAQLDQEFSAMPANLVQSVSISVSDTLSDLRRMIETQSRSLGVVAPEDRIALVETIIDKSRGSFLWTKLVLKELMRCHSRRDITRVLEDVPRGMESLYRRILDSMSETGPGKALAQAILLWTTCAIRAMTTGELHGALTFDIQDEFPMLEESISTLCGELVVVDKFGKIQMVHETAREFLLNPDLDSEFAINSSTANTRIAKTCLAYLVGDDMKPPRTNRRRAHAKLSPKRNAFASYACTAYSYHLSRSKPSSVEVFQLAQQFFKANVLSWIEAVASSQDLSQLPRASKHLKTYVNTCSIERSPLDPRLRALQKWVTDLARVPAMFSAALTESPSAIYSLIPPFCPSQSMIHSAATTGRRLEVIAAANSQWDDRLVSMGLREGQPSAVSYGEDFLAIGSTTGATTLYYVASYQEYGVLDHGEAVKFITFKLRSDLVVTCGLRTVKVWDFRNRSIIHELKSPPRPLGMAFKEDLLLIASHKSFVASWDLGQGALPQPVRPWYDTPDMAHLPRRSPCAFSISVSHGILAVAYSNQPITVWDIEDDTYVGSCGKKLPNGETSSHVVVVALVMNPNPTIELLAVAYLDGDLALIDPFNNEELECFRANCQTLGASPNGRLLAAGGADGTIQIYEFDTFRLLYRVQSTNSFVKQLVFARDNLRLADIRGSQCTVWEPEALLRDSIGDDSSGSTSTTILETVSLEAKSKITAIQTHPTDNVIFCGRDDGIVALYDRNTAEFLHTLHRHKSPVRVLAWSTQKSALISVDASNMILLHRVQKPAGEQWPSASVEVLFQARLDSEQAILDVMPAEGASRFIVSTRESDHLFTFEGEHVAQRTCLPGIRKWASHPQSSRHMICFDGGTARIHQWHDFVEVATVSLTLDTLDIELKSVSHYTIGGQDRLLLEFSQRDGPLRTSCISIFDMEGLNADIDLKSDLSDLARKGSSTDVPNLKPSQTDFAITPSTFLAPLDSQITVLKDIISHIIGLSDSGKLMFLDRSSWVCSVDLRQDQGSCTAGQRSPALEISRHFFVPSDWFAGRRDILCVLAQKDILLTRSGDLAIIRNWAEHSERVSRT